jgi:uncharacterized membrane protein
MNRFFITFGISATGVAVIAFFNIPHPNKMVEVFYTICGVLFSVGMSQIMAFDFSKVVDDENYRELTSSLSNVRSSFIIQFIIASISFLVFQILKSDNKPDLIFIVIKWEFNVCVFLSLIIVYSLFFFLYNFYELVRQKSKIDKVIHDEAQEDS